jgi:hypothetical protein
VTTVVTEVATEVALDAQVSTQKPDNTRKPQGEVDGDPPPWKELMPSALETRLLELTVEVDQMAKEYRESGTSRERRAQIHDYCLDLYRALVHIKDVDDEQKRQAKEGQDKGDETVY